VNKKRLLELNTVEEVLEDIRHGKPYILVDDPDRENEGDICLAADFVTPELINFMAKEAKGLICLAMPNSRADELGLPPMVTDNTSLHHTAFTVSIDATNGITTGISAHDRCHTIRLATRKDATPQDFVRPGHIFPLRSREGGVLVRAGHTEGSVDLSRLAGLNPLGIICEIMNEDGSMARGQELIRFARKHNLKITAISDLIEYRLRHEQLVTLAAESELPTDYGVFQIRVFESSVDSKDYTAIIKGDLKRDEPTLVRVHSECLTGDVFGSLRCDCGEQLHAALRQIEAHGSGVVLYLRQEGRGIGLKHKIKAYKLQESGLDTVEANEKLGFSADLRHYGLGAQVLKALGVQKMRLMTNNPVKIVGLGGYGLEVVERVPLEVASKSDNLKYLKTKKSKMGHLLSDII